MDTLNYKYMINRLTDKHDSTLKFLLFFKILFPSTLIVYYILSFIYVIGLLIISNSFLINPLASGLRLTETLRKLTSFYILGNISRNTYEIISLIIILTISIYILLMTKLYKNIKNIENYILEENSFLVKIIRIFTTCLMILSQHIKEYLTFSIIMIFQIDIIKDYSLFSNTVSFYIVCINSISFVFFNFFEYFLVKTINQPMYQSRFPVSIRETNLTLFLLFVVTKMQSIHYLEILINNSKVIYIKCALFAILDIIMLLHYYKRFKSYNFQNSLLNFIEYLFTYCFFSTIVEVFLHLIDRSFTDNLPIIILVIKLALTINFIKLNKYLKNKNFKKKCKDMLFKEYFYQTLHNADIDAFYYFLDLIYLYKLKNDKNKMEQIVEIILAHKMDCTFEYCTCKAIGSNYQNLDFLLESIFNNLNFMNDPNVNILYSEYLIFIKKTCLFSYALLNTFINKNRFSIFDKSRHLFISFRSIFIYNNDYCKKMSDFLMFDKIFSNVRIQKKFNKRLEIICKVYDYFINFKDRFDNCLKYSDTYVDSYIFDDIDIIVKNCSNFREAYKNLKQTIRSYFRDNKCVNVELSHKLSSFFLIFNGKIPMSIHRILIDESDQGYIKLKNLNDAEKNFQIIFQVNKIFEIKYFSYKLAQLLGYTHEQLIGEDIHLLFPSQLKENHKKVILKYLLIENNFKLIKKTFAFTNYYNILPIVIKTCSFPNFSKNLCFISNVEVLNEDDKKVFYFILSDDFNIISINTNLDKYYNINYELLNKMNADLLKLFGINHSIVVSRFKQRLEYLQGLREIKNFFGVFRNIFNLNLYADENDKRLTSTTTTSNRRKTVNSTQAKKKTDDKDSLFENSRVTLKDSKNSSTSFDLKNVNNKKFYKKKSTEPMALKTAATNVQNSQNQNLILRIEKEKILFIHNLEKFKSRAVEFDLNIEQNLKIDSCLTKLRDSAFTHFNVKIQIKNYIDTPFYIIRIYEVNKSTNKDNFTSVVNNVKQTSVKYIGAYEEIQNVLDDSDSTKSINKDLITMKTQFSKDTQNYLVNKNDKEKDTTKTYSIKNDPNRLINPSIVKHVKRLIILLIVIITSINIYIFYFKNTSFNYHHSLFTVNYWNNIQQTSLNFLHSSILSLVYHLVGITDFQTQNPVGSIIDLIKQRSSHERIVFKKFYSEMLNLNDETILSLIFEQRNFSKTILSWEEVLYNSNFYIESNYLHNDITLLTKADDYDSLRADLLDLLFQKYKAFESKLQISSYGKLIYHLNENIPKNYIDVIHKIGNYILDTLANNYIDSKFIFIIIETINFAFCFSLIILITFIIIKYDVWFYNSIIGMFLDDRSLLNSTYKTPKKIYEFKGKLRLFRDILNNVVAFEKEEQLLSNIRKNIKTDAEGGRPFSKFSKLERKSMLLSQNIKNISDFKEDGSLYKKKEDIPENIITNNSILSNMKHYQIKFIKIAKFLIFFVFLILFILFISNLLVTINQFDEFNSIQIVSNALILRYSSICQLFNYVRLIILNYSPKVELYKYESYEKMLDNIDLINNNYTQFLTEHSLSLPETWNFGNMIDGELNDINKPYLCTNVSDLCGLNSRGIGSGIHSSIFNIKTIFRDYLLKQSDVPDLQLLQSYFTTDMFKLVNLEVEYVFGAVNDEFANIIFNDIETVFDGIQTATYLLGFISIISNLIILFYLIFGFIAMLNFYFKVISYSCQKFNGALFNIK
jgi:hypothetical protein